MDFQRNEINHLKKNKVSSCGTFCGGGKERGNERDPQPPGTALLSSISCILHLLGESDNREVGDPPVGGWGYKVGIRNNFLEEGLLSPGKAWMKLEGRGESHVSKDQEPVPCPTLYLQQGPYSTPTQAVSASSPSLWSQKYKVMTETMPLQVAAENYKLEPEEQLGAWIQDMELCRENER